MERAIEVWDGIVTVVKFWMRLLKAKQPNSDNKCYTRLKDAITDPLIKTKFKLFATVAKSLSSFLVTFQTDLFLAKSIEEIMRNYASPFLLKETLSNQICVYVFQKLTSRILRNKSVRLILNLMLVLS